MLFSFAIITLSTKGARGDRVDTSGPNLSKILKEHGYLEKHYEIISDDRQILTEKLCELCEDGISLILTTGGTGVSPSDCTPEAMDDIIEREIPGIAELMRLKSLEITDRACLSRGKAGIRKNTLIINLPGSKKAAQENLEFILSVLPHALEKINGDESDCAR